MAKRTFDLVVGGALLLAALPVMVVVALAVLATQGRPVLFCQPRPGLHGEVFRLCKFRTMRDLRGPDGALLPDAQRLTSVGRFLRATSLDELPTLWHVLKGDMSLVGPRPLLVEYLERYTPEQTRRHEVRPGITGLAQVSGRNALTWEDKLALDVRYVDTHSLWLDLRILARTVPVVLRAMGVSRPGHATSPRLGEPEDEPGA